MSRKSALLPGLVQWTLENADQSSHTCAFGCGYLFLDVCGFTKLTEKVSDKGHYGVEAIINLLNQYFDLLAAVEKRGSTVIMVAPLSMASDIS